MTNDTHQIHSSSTSSNVAAVTESKPEDTLATIIEMPTDETKDEPVKSDPVEERRKSLTVVVPKPEIMPKKVVGGKWL